MASLSFPDIFPRCPNPLLPKNTRSICQLTSVIPNYAARGAREAQTNRIEVFWRQLRVQSGFGTRVIGIENDLG
jgi:hypothetical protein